MPEVGTEVRGVIRAHPVELTAGDAEAGSALTTQAPATLHAVATGHGHRLHPLRPGVTYPSSLHDNAVEISMRAAHKDHARRGQLSGLSFRNVLSCQRCTGRTPQRSDRKSTMPD